MAIDYSQFALSKGTPRVLSKATRAREADAALREAYKAVDARDGVYSQISGRPTVANAVDPRMRREHHHLKPRSTHPELIAEPSNVFVCTAQEHQLIHAGAIEIEGTDASQRLIFRFNRRIVPRGQEPFVLLPRRRSQRRLEE